MQTHITDFENWKIPGYDHVSGDKHSHKVIVGLDVEYESNAKVEMNMGGRQQTIKQRNWDDIISMQLAFNFENNNPRKVFIHRDSGDRYFNFYDDFMKPLKQYLLDIGVYRDLKHELKDGHKKYHPFTIELWGFFLGVDISSYTDYISILTEGGNSSDPSKLVTIHGNTVFTGRPLKLIVKDKYRHQVDLFPEMRLVIRDMLKLAPAKSNLAQLGQIIGLPKLDTEEWDQEAGKPKGYFKDNMSELWKQWPDRFEKYAMTDTVITVLYGSFIISFMQRLNDDGLSKFKPVELKPSLSSISANVVARRNREPEQWIIDYIIQDLIKMLGKGKCDVSDFEAYLHPFFRHASRDENLFFNVIGIYRLFNVPKLGQISDDALEQASALIADLLNFDLIRKGYYFPSNDNSNSKNHKRLTNDITKKKDLPKATYFNQANDAFYGGYNIVLRAGVMPQGPVKRDYDLKSAYTTAGHALPDIAPGLGTIKTYKDVNADQFKAIVDWTETINGPYTVGVGSFRIEYPDDYDGFVITPQKVEDGPRYFRTIKSVTLSYTDAYTAWSCGAKVHVNTLAFPSQAILNPTSMQGVSNEGHIQDMMQDFREKYDKTNPLNEMYKLISNIVYGGNSMGLKEHTSMDFNVQKSFYVPFSAITNPFKAIQYTSITRYHITLLQQAIKQVDSDAVFLNNVTDGCLVQSDKPLDANAITNVMGQLATPRYRAVVKNHFNGIYFEEKDGTTDMVANLRTRFTFSPDAELHAMVGIKMSDVSPKAVFDQYMNKQAVKVPTNKHLITSINDMKNNTKFKHLQGSWNQPTDIYLGYDFACWPTEYHTHGQFCDWSTRFYEDVDEFNKVWAFGRELIKYGPFYASEYAPFFKKTLDEQGNHDWKEPAYFGEYLKDDDDNSNPKIGNEIYASWVQYVTANHLDPDASYQQLQLILIQHQWAYVYGSQDRLPKVDSFKRLLKKQTTRSMVINYVLLHRIGLI